MDVAAEGESEGRESGDELEEAEEGERVGWVAPSPRFDPEYPASISRVLRRVQSSLGPGLRVPIPAIEAVQAQSVAKSVAPAIAKMATLQKQTRAIARGVSSQLDTSALDSVVKTLQPLIEAQESYRKLSESLRPVVEAQQKQLARILEAAAKGLDRLYPENWHGIDRVDWTLAESVCLDEGIPLAGVPRRDTVQALLAESDGDSRRRMLARRWRSISSDCSRVLDGSTQVSLRSDVWYASKAVDALQAGHSEAAQALAANLIDTMVKKHFGTAEFRGITTNRADKPPLDPDRFALHVALVVAPVWSAYADFWVNRGDAIPTSFARHATAHAVSSHQFTRANAVQAIMIVTSLIWLLEREATTGI